MKKISYIRQHKLFCLFFYSICIISLLCISCIAGTARYLPIKNGNFEEGTLDDWKSYGLDQDETVIIARNSNVHRGSFALKMVKSKDKSNAGIYQAITPMINPGNLIRATAWVKTETAGGFELHMGITVKNSKGELSQWGNDMAIPLSEDWKRVYIECRLPTLDEMPDFKWVDVVIGIDGFGRQPAIYVDDLIVKILEQ